MRTRAHQLEDESIRAFEAVLPAAWVPRAVERDYGIDRTVEIFSEDGAPTGRSFHVQLKATDQLDLAKAMAGRVRFGLEKVEYYRSLPLPLLVVLYHAPTAKLFARWFHAHDSQISGSPPPGASTPKSMGLPFSAADELDADHVGDLEAGVRGFLAFRSTSLQLPLRLAVAAQPGFGNAAALAFGLRRALAPVVDLVAVEAREPEPDEPSVRNLGDVVRVSLAGVSTVDVERAGQDDGTLGNELAVALAVALAKVGQDNLAAQIGLVAASLSRAIADFDVSFALAGAMYRARRLREAIAVADELDASKDEDVRLAATGFLMALLAARRVSDDDRRLAVEAAERRIERRLARGEDTYAGAEAYSLAMRHRSAGDGPSAIAAFERAMALEPAYDQRAYFHRDLAGPLFETGRYEEAAEHYRRAIELGDRGLVQALHADALLCSGRYAEAELQLDEYVAQHTDPDDAEWRQKRRILPMLRAIAGDQMPRRPDESERLLTPVDLTDPALELDTALLATDAAIAADPCNGEAWFRWSLVRLARDENVDAAAGPMLAAAVLLRFAVHAWANAVLLVVDTADDDHLLDLLYLGYRYNGDEFADTILAAAAGGDPQRGARLTLLLERAAVLWEDEDRSESFTVRFNSDDGVVRELVIKPDAP